MMKRVLLLIILCLPAHLVFASSQVAVLSYHDVTDDQPIIHHVGITTDMLIQHFDWLHGNGYNPISMQQWVDASEGGEPLPENAVLLTFDDGYASFYTRVLPLLKAYNYPAVLALVGAFVSPSLDSFSVYGGEKIPRREFMTWAQLTEVRDSGLVEIASHTYDMHKGALANKEGNVQPEAFVHLYLKAEQRYETDAEYRQRVATDLKQNNQFLKDKLGITPRVLVWPYGSYTGEGVDIAKTLGMPITLTLDSGMAKLNELARIPRLLVDHDWDINVLAAELRDYKKKPEPVRAVHVDLDYVWDPDPAQQEVNLGLLLDRIKDFNITTVYLQAYSDMDGDSVADALYYPNRHLPMKADLFNRVSWQLSTRAGVEVFAWLPVLAFETKDKSLGVEVFNHDSGEITIADSLFRLSPWKIKARNRVIGIYEDLSRQARVAGILFSDDAMLGDSEDASDEAELANAMKKYQSKFKMARNLFARPVLEPHSKAWFAQSLPSFLPAYDQVALMAMPYLEHAENNEQWMQALFDKVKAQPHGIEKVVFEFQTVDWERPGRPDISSSETANSMRQLQIGGAINFAYYPDDFIRNHPNKKVIHPAFSLEWYPFK